MAAAVLIKDIGKDELEVLCRGLVVSFPEPLNQKTEAVMIRNGYALEEFTTKQLMNDEITDQTLVFVMEEKQRQHILEKYDNAKENNVFVLSEYVGEELEIMDPYGAPLQTYGICFESIKNAVQKLVEQLKEKGQI